MTTILISSLACYIMGVLLCKSHIFHPVRVLFRLFVGIIPGIRNAFTIQTDFPSPLVTDIDIEEYKGETVGFDFISCRLCTGFYITLAWMMAADPHSITLYPISFFQSFLATYGLSYFMAKLEQP
jgi:hypothetical protein